MARHGAESPNEVVRSDHGDGRSADGDRSRRWSRVAGAVLLAVGVANVGFGALSLTTDLVRLAPPDAGILAVLGAATGALGALVWQARRWAVTLSLVVFGVLFVLQALATTTAEEPVGTLPALVTLALVVAPLVLAQRDARAQRG